MTRYIPTFTVLAAALLLSACAGMPETRATVSLGVACDSIGSTLMTLAPYRAEGSLSDRQVRVVTGIRDATEPYCAVGSNVDPAEVTGFVRENAARLRAIYEEVK